MRQSTSPSSEFAAPQKNVATENPTRLQNMTLRTPKRATSHPLMGVTMAVARMLNVTVQEISSCVAATAPCICGRIAVAVNVAAIYVAEPITTTARTSIRRPTDSSIRGLSSSRIASALAVVAEMA